MKAPRGLPMPAAAQQELAELLLNGRYPDKRAIFRGIQPALHRWLVNCAGLNYRYAIAKEPVHVAASGMPHAKDAPRRRHWRVSVGADWVLDQLYKSTTDTR